MRPARLRRQIRYELSALLDYLTPAEAAMALWAHCHEQRLGLDVELAVAQVDTVGGITVVTWHVRPQAPSVQSTVSRVADSLPNVVTVTPDAATMVCGHNVQATGRASALVTDAATGATTAVLTAPTSVGLATPGKMASQARELLTEYTGPDLISLEAGHIHLDRDLDRDQDSGAAIGAALHLLLQGRQERPPVLTPMMDDDHVLVRLTPAAYRSFLRRTFSTAPMHLICESSPIIRAIVVALFQRLRNSRLTKRLQSRGGNLFLHLDDGGPVELFEDIDGDPITGCVFFEVALLIYRSAPDRFDTYFTDRYQLDTGVHEHAAALMSRHHADSGGGHDAIVTAMQRYRRRFADVTDPHRPDRHIVALVTEVLEAADPLLAHLNVLEDYYEVQQRRVRALIGILNLPLRLVTVHFNATTGRVVLTDE